MGPIFNEKVAEKWGLWGPWTVHENTVRGRKVKKLRLGKKKNFWNVNVCLGSAKRASQTHPNYIAYGYADKGTQLIYQDSKSISNKKAKCQI